MMIILLSRTLQTISMADPWNHLVDCAGSYTDFAVFVEEEVSNECDSKRNESSNKCKEEICALGQPFGSTRHCLHLLLKAC